MLVDLDHQIATCQQCRDGLVIADWTPISFFGDYYGANAWAVSINPSAREFLGTDGRPLTGQKQRFRRLSDFNGVKYRHHLKASNIQEVIQCQRTIFERVPYRPFFNRLGRFLSRLHGAVLPEDPLEPFTTGAVSAHRKTFRYVHMDVVKCATARPWGELTQRERSSLATNCSPYLEQQVLSNPNVELILCNGRTTFANCLPFLSKLGYNPEQTRLDLGHTSCDVWSGTITLTESKVLVIGWSANVVNQQLAASAIDALVKGIQRTCPELQ